MEKGIIFDERPEYILDLGTGFSNIHLNIIECDGTYNELNTVTKFKSDVIRIMNPATDENILIQIKEQVINQLKDFDKSENVNSFHINNVKMWIDKETRVGLMLRLEAEKSAGKTSTMLWNNGTNYSFDIEIAKQMLIAIELYASTCYDVTSNHISNILNLSNPEDVINYDYKLGYPVKLSF